MHYIGIGKLTLACAEILKACRGAQNSNFPLSPSLHKNLRLMG